MLTSDRLRELLHYDAETGEFTWLVQPKYGRVRCGDRAGTDHNEGYRAIAVDGVLYLAHRLAWLYVYGEWPSTGVDHANRDRQDNRITNLRLANKALNAMNSKRRADNKSGIRGVGPTKDGKMWRARIKINGRERHLGQHPTKDAAAAAYEAAARQIYGEYAPPQD